MQDDIFRKLRTFEGYHHLASAIQIAIVDLLFRSSYFPTQNFATEPFHVPDRRERILQVILRDFLDRDISDFRHDMKFEG